MGPIKITPTKRKMTPTKRTLYMSPQMLTPQTTSIKTSLSPFDSLQKVRCRETQIGHFSEGGRSRKKPRRSRNMVRKDSPSRSGSTISISGDGQGMSGLWDDDDDVKSEENVSQSPTQQLRLSFSPCDTKKERAFALNSPTETESVGDEKKDLSIASSQSPKRLPFQSPSFSSADTKKTRSIRGRAVALNSHSPTECVRKHLFFGEAEEDEKDEESQGIESGSDAGSELDFLLG